MIERLPRWARGPAVVAALLVIVFVFYLRVTDTGKELAAQVPRWMLVGFVLLLGFASMRQAFRVNEETRQQMARVPLVSHLLLSRLPVGALRVVLFVLGAGIFGLGLWGLVELA